MMRVFSENVGKTLQNFIKSFLLNSKEYDFKRICEFFLKMLKKLNETLSNHNYKTLKNMISKE